ncbi:MAG: hypothetical protein ACI81R_000693 [Bradymonadia bacterium]
MIDFNDAVPCDSDNDCLTGERCDQDFSRCVDDDEIARDTGDENDVDGLALDAVPDSSIDVVGDADDAVSDAVNDTQGDAADADDVSDSVNSGDVDSEDDTLVDAPDVVTDGCSPTEEVCDGLDNDCDGVPDNGLECGECGAGATLVESGEARFCIDLYEASRTDATADAEGIEEGSALSRAGVLPWAGVTFDEARQACEAGGRRLCSAAEWQLACRGAGGQLYPYSGAYRGDACHGVNAPPPGAATPAGIFSECESPFGLLDQSGNVAEWTADLVLRGGSFEEPELTLQCRSRLASATGQSPTNTYGFRCCSEP